ncbi:dual specificity protein phosphatase family protein [Actinidia rufa]|uniref:Dual specificity protein phosphatase family protein n=1 Tax=Actinidia rufa TaxID=165716 RepID=A0A7J0FZ08_9ERIC|nr:dual specificity protein phosphatase family protein [Actinidia rufa]
MVTSNEQYQKVSDAGVTDHHRPPKSESESCETVKEEEYKDFDLGSDEPNAPLVLYVLGDIAVGPAYRFKPMVGTGNFISDSKIYLPSEQATEISLWERRGKAAMLDIESNSFSWDMLSSLHHTERSSSTEHSEDEMNKALEVTVNSGGVVFFALFNQPMLDEFSPKEAAAVIKISSSRMATQSERLGYEFAKWLGVQTPQGRVIHNSSPEWLQIKEAAEKARDAAIFEGDEVGELTCSELLEALELSRCLFLMKCEQNLILLRMMRCNVAALNILTSFTACDQPTLYAQGGREKPISLVNLHSRLRKPTMPVMLSYVHGAPLLDSSNAFDSRETAEKTAAALGRILVLDLVIRNEDRLPCRQLRWHGNSANLLLADKVASANMDALEEAFNSAIKRYRSRNRPKSSNISLESQSSNASTVSDFHIVAIDSGVPRRPPAGKRINDQEKYPKLVELLINSSNYSSNLLYEITRGKLGSPPDDADVMTDLCLTDMTSVVREFRSGFRAALRDLQGFQIFLLTLHQKLDSLLRLFLNIINRSAVGEIDKEDLMIPELPSQAAVIGIHSSPPNKERVVDVELNKELEQWNEMLRNDAVKLCQENNFNTGFFEGSDNNSVVDAYELKVRLEHILERIALISDAANTEKPSSISDGLFIGGALAARSVYTLQHLGITHILCLCSNEIGQSDSQYPELFEYRNFSICDDEDTNISNIFEEAHNFIDHIEQTDGKVLVHCFEGRSRSATVVLAYLNAQKKAHKMLLSGSLDSAMTMDIQKALSALRMSQGGSVSPTQAI